MTADHNISATFAIKTYTITATAGANGNIAPSGAVVVNCGADQTFNITADACYEISDVVVDGSSAGAVTSYTFSSVTADHNISATFSVITCTLTVNVTPSGGGNVTVNGTTPSNYPNSTTWNCGENVTVNAVAAGGYEFDHWSGDLSGSVNPTDITMDSNKDVIAYFSHVGIHYNLTVNVTPGDGGDINVSGVTPGSYPHSYTFNESELVNLTAVPAGGYCFVNWSGDLSGSINPTDITMTSDKNVTAHFTPIYNLTVTSNGCCPINVSGAASGTVSAGGSETFTGIVEGGSVTVSADDSAVCCEFDSWSDGKGQIHNITMDSDKSVTAYCSVPSYDLTVDVSPGGGNVTVNGTTPSSYPNTTTWVCGDNVTVNAVAAGGYEFVSWSGDLSGNATPVNITMDGDKSVTANFEEESKICVSPLSLPLTAAPNTTVTATYTITNCGGGTLNWDSSNVTYDPNGNMTWLSQNITSGSLTANASDTVLVTVNTTGLGVGTYNAFITITGSTFVLPIILDVIPTGTYNLTILSTSGGNVSINGVTPSSYPNTTVWNASEEVTLCALADVGYSFVNWSGDLSGNATSVNITMDGDKSVTANFEEEHLPEICVDPGSLPLTVAPNTTVTATYTITNCGGGTLNWDSSNVTYVPNGNMSWLSQNITSGSLTANASDTVLVTVNTTGLEEGTYRAFITITGSTFIFEIILDVTTDIDVMRDLPPDALDPDAEYPGDSFYVYVNFTSPVANFNAIGLTDLAPAGWDVVTNVDWCLPVADETKSPDNKAEYSWYGPYGAGQVFSAKYLVYIPATADVGLNDWPDGDCDLAWVEYWFGAYGPFESCITGEWQKLVTVPGNVYGETRDVNANLLTSTMVRLYEEVMDYEDDDSSIAPDATYENDVDDTGLYWQSASKYCYFTLDTNNMTGSRNPWHEDNINFTTVELLAAGYNMDFEGDYGLVPKACTMSYAMESVNHWLYVPADAMSVPHPEWQLSAWKAMEAVHSWQFPAGCNT